jgi:hypothetical protein
MFSFNVMIASFVIFVLDAIILLNYHNEEVHGLEERILILIDRSFAIAFGIFLISAVATLCQIFGWVE